MSEIVKEKIWVENQKIEEISGIIFKAKIRNRVNKLDT